VICALFQDLIETSEELGVELTFDYEDTADQAKHNICEVQLTVEEYVRAVEYQRFTVVTFQLLT
jgi:hypothetical protein